MRPDDLEFIIAQYADGSLDATRLAQLEVLLRRDAAARAMLESYRAVDRALAGLVASQPAPEVPWDRLGARISQQVSALATSTSLVDETEEAISRLSSGDVSPEELQALQPGIAADAHRRLVLGEYRSLDRALEGARAEPLPQVRWEPFARHISSVIDRVEQASAEALRFTPQDDHREHRRGGSTRVLGRIGHFLSQPRRLALAACVLVAASISLQLINRDESGGGRQLPTNSGAIQPTPRPEEMASRTPTASPALDIRVGPSHEPSGSTVTSIKIGPPTGPGYDLTALADWARESQSIIGKATTRPDDEATDQPAEPSDPGTLFNQ